jgi:cell division septation protein DedD
MDRNQHYNARHVSTRESAGGGLFSSPLPFALALVGGGAVIFCLWYFFYSGSHGASNQPIPVIKAEAGPMKVRPDSASQPEVPHQDKLVYGRVNPAEQGATVERLLPPTEEPMETMVDEVPTGPAVSEGFPTTQSLAENKSEFRVEPHDPGHVVPTKEIEKLEQPAPVAKETTVTVDQVEGAKVAEIATAVVEEEKPAKAEVKSEPAKGKTLQSGYRIQLASMKSQDAAKQEWQRLQGEHKNVLSGLTANFARVDLGAKKGIFYRVQAGDFSSKTEAQNVCNKMKGQNSNVGCFIVKY